MSDAATSSMLETATLGGGCFWCVEAVFSETRGVSAAISGYMGGTRPGPTYEQVCSGTSGHVEVVQVTFDPAIITFRDVLHIFFTAHDPTTLNRQGNDVGTQYRSVIFLHSTEQESVAKEVIAEMTVEKVYVGEIVTALEPASAFFTAETYHQSYFENNPHQPYCAYIVAPKVMKFRKKFAGLLRT